jgi:hypothetical protein
MSLERAIHELWGMDFGLSALVPVQRVFTGRAAGGTDLPYVVIARRASRPLVRTSSGTAIDEATLRLAIRAPGLDAAKRIAAEFRRRFERRHFDQAGVSILDCRPAARSEDPEADGVWRVTLDYHVLFEPPG